MASTVAMSADVGSDDARFGFEGEGQRRGRRRWRWLALVVAAAAVAAGGGWLAFRGGTSGSASSLAAVLSRQWHPAATSPWYFGNPGNDHAAPDPVPVTCAGLSTPSCFVVVHANGIGLDGRPTRRVDPYDGLDQTALFRSSAGGPWSRVALPAGLWVSSPVSCASAEFCAVGAANVPDGLVGAPPPPNRSVLLTTANGGKTWQEHRAPGLMISQVSCSATSACTVISLLNDAYAEYPDLSHASEYIATGVFSTQDAGTTWIGAIYPGPSPERYSLTGISCTGPKVCYFVGTRALLHHMGSHGEVYDQGALQSVTLTTSRGDHLHVATGAEGYSVTCPTSRNCLVDNPSVSGVTLSVTTNGGNSWSTFVPTISAAQSSEDVDFEGGVSCPATRFCYLIDGYSGKLYVSGDEGRSWTQIRQPGGLLAASCTAAITCTALQQDSGQSPGASPAGNAVRPVSNYDEVTP